MDQVRAQYMCVQRDPQREQMHSFLPLHLQNQTKQSQMCIGPPIENSPSLPAESTSQLDQRQCSELQL